MPMSGIGEDGKRRFHSGNDLVNGEVGEPALDKMNCSEILGAIGIECLRRPRLDL